MYKIKLNNDVEYEILSLSFEPVIVIYAENPADMISIWENFSNKSATNKIEYYEDNELLSVFDKCQLIRIEVSQDPKYQQCYGSFYFIGTQRPYTDPEYKQAFDILVGEEDGV